MDSSDDEGRGRHRVGILELSPECATDNNFLRPPSPHSPGSPASGKRTSPSLISCAGRIFFLHFDFRFFRSNLSHLALCNLKLTSSFSPNILLCWNNYSCFVNFLSNIELLGSMV